MTELFGLVPVRNGGHFLPEFLKHGEHFLDGVIALDDGSTDDTGALLARAPLVKKVIAHPRRETAAGWDDLLNRNTLLRHLESIDYRGWALFLDADELLDVDDSRLLRGLIDERRLDESCAYGLRVFRMVDDLLHFYKKPLTVYRLFHFAPGQALVGARLHFQPIPAQIPESRWRKTNLRIKHRNSMTEDLRLERFQKYREADADHQHQASYDNLLERPDIIHEWSETRFTNLWQ